jgi:hypothetical protein
MVSPVRMRPMACGTRFLNSMCGSKVRGTPSKAAVDSLFSLQ